MFRYFHRVVVLLKDRWVIVIIDDVDRHISAALLIISLLYFLGHDLFNHQYQTFDVLVLTRSRHTVL